MAAWPPRGAGPAWRAAAHGAVYASALRVIGRSVREAAADGCQARVPTARTLRLQPRAQQTRRTGVGRGATASSWSWNRPKACPPLPSCRTRRRWRNACRGCAPTMCDRTASLRRSLGVRAAPWLAVCGSMLFRPSRGPGRCERGTRRYSVWSWLASSCWDPIVSWKLPFARFSICGTLWNVMTGTAGGVFEVYGQ